MPAILVVELDIVYAPVFQVTRYIAFSAKFFMSVQE